VQTFRTTHRWIEKGFQDSVIYRRDSVMSIFHDNIIAQTNVFYRFRGFLSDAREKLVIVYIIKLQLKFIYSEIKLIVGLIISKLNVIFFMII
jgi:hypothetical protein